MIINCRIGQGTRIMHGHLTNLYECKIGNNCMIGEFVTIQKGVKIGDNCKIESHTFICEGVTIGNNVFIGHNVTFTNDRYPGINKEWKLEKTIINDGVSIGSGVVLLPVTVGKNSTIGAGSVVTKDVEDNVIIKGNPAT